MQYSYLACDSRVNQSPEMGFNDVNQYYLFDFLYSKLQRWVLNTFLFDKSVILIIFTRFSFS
jgi:hypothetical protein